MNNWRVEVRVKLRHMLNATWSWAKCDCGSHTQQEAKICMRAMIENRKRAELPEAEFRVAQYD